MLCMTAVARTTGAESEVPAGDMLEDADLTAVFFLDSDLGWVVGERGVILRTENGGRQWEVLQSPVNCRLESVHFVDAQQGWAVGGRVHSYSQRTSGVVLRTQDGGRTWTPIPGLTIPMLKSVRFLNPQQGWAAGGATTLYPTGILRTDDGGRSWSALPSGPCGSWLTADFRDFQTGIVAGREGLLAWVAAPTVEGVESSDMPGSCWRAVRLGDSRNGWAAGDGGRLLCTTDGGRTWTPPAGAWPAELSSLFDFHALAVFGNHVWVAGTPGVGVLHSPDGGSTWELGPTDQTLPLRALTFVDAERGWAVGALGTVLGTRDGGRTWRRLRGGGTRVALLGIFSEPSRVPWELFAWECAQEGYLGAVELIARRDARGSDRASAVAEEDTARAAMAAVGGSSADGTLPFALPDPGLRLGSRALLDGWNRASGGRALDVLEARLVRTIRQWRPEIVVTEAASPQGADPVGHLLNQLVLSAVRSASDHQAQPAQLSLGGLQPWTVKKVFQVVPGEQQPTVTVTTSQLVTRLGCAVADLASEANARVLPRYRPVPPTVGLQLLVDELPQSAGRKDIFSGIFLPAGGDARRPAALAAARDLDALRVAAQKRRNIEQIIASAEGGAPQSAGWLGQIQDLTKSLGTAGAGEVLYQLGQRYLETGELALAAQSFAQLVERYPGHALSESALEWLIQYYASSEIAWQLYRRQQPQRASPATVALAAPPAGGVSTADYAAPPGVSIGGATADFTSGDAAGPARFEGTLQERAAQALRLSKLIQQARPELFAEPRVQFPVSVAYRYHDQSREAEKLHHRLGASPLSPDWARCAMAEQWLAKGRGASPKTTYYIARAASRPRLDGQLDDELWGAVEPLALHSGQDDDAAWHTTIMLACDQEFLFLAGTCRKPPQAPPTSTAAGPRMRDAPLDEHDRIDLLIDLDRDYVSFYRLTVDHRGWAGEACLGDASWNPVWYVASQETATDWTLEVAIPLEELTAHPPQAQDVWAVGVQRIVPGTGLQAFTQPAATDPLGQGFGWMVFR
jgi:photosystem II stability/assembly factor-like uncharacterized protein